jgi:hypothetical protein
MKQYLCCIEVSIVHCNVLYQTSFGSRHLVCCFVVTRVKQFTDTFFKQLAVISQTDCMFLCNCCYCHLVQTNPDNFAPFYDVTTYCHYNTCCHHHIFTEVFNILSNSPLLFYVSIYGRTR